MRVLFSLRLALISCIVLPIMFTLVMLAALFFDINLSYQAYYLDGAITMFMVYFVFVFMTCMISFLTWLYSTYRYVYYDTKARVTLAPHRALSGFVVPIINLYRPYQIILRVSRGFALVAHRGDK